MSNNVLRYILTNLIEDKVCIECGAMWFCFNHEGKKAYYRLGKDEPCNCKICKPIDDDLEQNCLMSAERWMSGDEL